MLPRKLSIFPRLETISLEEDQFIKVDWKIKSIFSTRTLEERFCLGDGICQLCFGSGLSEERVCVDEIFIAINMHELDQKYRKFRIRCFIEDSEKKPQFPYESSFDSADTGIERIWCAKTKDCRKIERTLVNNDVATFILLFTPVETALWKTKPEIDQRSTQTSLPVDPVRNLESLSLDLRHLLDDHAHSDVTLRCEDRTFSAHRAILSVRSEVFSAMLHTDALQSRDGVITITDIDLPTLKQVLQYIYSGSIPDLSSKTAQRLYEAADKYALESLKTQCSDFMKEKPKKENTTHIFGGV